ncbi:hypothetical protein M405DRAFT_860955 [Rhizopogon salebrosus TDB-379]|nr:hypothetical protein M405DRAFT_860955 [Rhizopogon salebrosus TDB-379]
MRQRVKIGQRAFTTHLATVHYSNYDPSVEPMAFLTELATNATAQGISVVIFSGNDDSLIPHLGSQVTIQNTTFGGIQGFTRKPSTPWYDDDGEFAGIVHQERNWTYVLVAHASHLVGYANPESGLVLVREFIFGNNQTGLVTNSSGTVTVIGGEVSSLANEIMTGQAGIYYGSATTESTYYFPTATVKAWNAYIPTATAKPMLISFSMLSLSNQGSSLDALSVQEREAVTVCGFSSSSHPRRELVFRGRLTMRCFYQLSLLIGQLGQLIRIDPFGVLPCELSLKVLAHLNTTSLRRTAQVSEG